MQSHPARDGRPLRLILLHGLASTPREFGFLQHPLRRQGVKLEAPEVAGYSAGSLAARPRWRDWVAAAGGTVEALARASDAPFMLGGLCTGAMLALAVAGARPLPGLRGLALMSPLFAYDGWGLPWWYRLRGIAYATGLAGRFSMAERTPYGLKNERMRQLIRQQLAAGETSLVGPARVPLSVVRESERLSRHARALLPGLRLPTLVQHAREKLARKNVPLIVGNLGPATFGRDDNALVLVDAQGERELPQADKLTLARALVDEIARRLD